MKIILCGHTGSENRGCEAIVRSVCSILRSTCKNAVIYLATFDKKADVAAGLDSVVDEFIEYGKIKRFSPGFFWYGLWHKLFHNDQMAQWVVQRKLWRKIDGNTMLLKIGGDIYCYDRPVIPYALNRVAKKRGAKNILFGCSVEKSRIDTEMAQDLRQYQMIFARESITFQTIADAGVPADRLRLYPDPAFSLKYELFPVEDLRENNTIGMNISPLILDSGREKTMVMKNYERLTEYILNETRWNILLIPHVYANGNKQDLAPLTALYQ